MIYGLDMGLSVSFRRSKAYNGSPWTHWMRRAESVDESS